MNFITELFNHYGYIVLYIALTLELIAFPTPGEMLMTYCGFLVFQGNLSWIISIVVATAGVITGITISYFVGSKFGNAFFRKYGKYVHMGPDKLERTSKWFDKYGNGLISVAYFIPGIRHITGYFSGITKIPFRRFAINAYIGALLWTSTFISLGKVLGPDWEKFHGSIKKYLIIGGIVISIILITIYLYRTYKQVLVQFIVKSMENSFRIFHSLGRIKIIVAGAAVIFLSLSILVVGLIQDLLANEFSQFDMITTYLISLIIPQNWSTVIKYFGALTIFQTLIILSVLLSLWIFIKGKNKFLEFRFLLLTILGGEVLEELLRIVFHRIGPLGLTIVENAKYNFPSEQSFMTVVTYGFAAFIILRHTKVRSVSTAIIIIFFIICFLVGINPLFFQHQYPSDVFAGYVFGGVWLSLNIILLEVFRIIPSIKPTNKI